MNVVKLLPPLTIGEQDLASGLGMLADAVRSGVGALRLGSNI